MNKNNYSSANCIPSVTVVVVCLNHSNYVQECIESVLRQDYKNIRLLVLDNGSTDGSVEIIERIKREKPYFDFIKNSRISLVSSLNAISDQIFSDYMAVVSADDYFYSNKIKKQVYEMERDKNIGACASRVDVVNENSDLIRRRSKFQVNRFTFKDILLGEYVFPAPSMMFRLKLLKDLGGYDESILIEDHWLLLALSSRGYSLLLINDYLAAYRRHDENLSSKLEWMVEQRLLNLRRYRDSTYYNLAVNRLYAEAFMVAAKSNIALALWYLSKISLSKKINVYILILKGFCFLIIPRKLMKILNWL